MPLLQCLGLMLDLHICTVLYLTRRLSGADVPEAGEGEGRVQVLQVLQDEELKENAEIEMSTLKKKEN